MRTPADIVLKRFRVALDKMYGTRLERVVLFGSQARGDAGADSDYDVAIFLSSDGMAFDRWAELDKLAAMRVRFLDETGAFFDAKPYLAAEYQDRSPLMHDSAGRG